jgi:hypothetical protein
VLVTVNEATCGNLAYGSWASGRSRAIYVLLGDGRVGSDPRVDRVDD